ncbi:MAG: hypothetical protein ACI9BW_000486 [Gammaproteobacteria bacterium]|jgi:hypothetical protein
MQDRKTVSEILDILGVTLLLGAGISLTSILWLTQLPPESALFNYFYGCLCAALMSFSIARVADIAKVVFATPNQKLVRANAVLEAVDLEQTELATGTAKVINGDFTRAA